MHSGAFHFARMAGSSIAGLRRGALGDRLPERGLLPPGTRRARRRRPASRLLRADHLLAARARPAPAPRRSAGVSARRSGRARFSTTNSAARDARPPTSCSQGAARLLGDWFPEAYADDARRGWGIAFTSPGDRAGYDPGHRMALARLGRLTPERAPRRRADVAHLSGGRDARGGRGRRGAHRSRRRGPTTRPRSAASRRCAAAASTGRHSRSRSPPGQKGAARSSRAATSRSRACVTAADPAALAAWVEALEDGLARYGVDEPAAVPGRRHGAGRARPDDPRRATSWARATTGCCSSPTAGTAWVRAAGTWDPMPWPINQAYRIAGRDAQHAFWGQGNLVAKSLLHQLALRLAA